MSLGSLVAALHKDSQNVKGDVVLDGYSLTLGGVVAASRSFAPVSIPNDPKLRKRINDSVNFVNAKVDISIYGLNTGFGGSADLRTLDPPGLQIALIEHVMSGLISTATVPNGPAAELSPLLGGNTLMPDAITRGALMVRTNSLVRGHSGVRFEILDAFTRLLNARATPLVPLRGSISASGDIGPLGFCVGAVVGHPDVRVHVWDEKSQSGKIVSAVEALKLVGMEPIPLGPKEGLGLINGTAFSASAGALMVHNAAFLAALALGTTALTVEAMVGRAGSFHPFIHEVARPHPGQAETARIIASLLSGSNLVSDDEEVPVRSELDKLILRQDRYALRTSPQWSGPQVEDIVAAAVALQQELNTTTDNPLIDVEHGKVHHCGNFQAMTVTNQAEKVRIALQNLGKMSYGQATELINVAMNRGLPSCLAFDEPSTDYHCKGLDVHMASYLAELGHVTNPVSTHVQSAEQHNQAINSMALVSARKTLEAADLLTMILASHLYLSCQALDLRIIDLTFRASLAASLPDQLSAHLGAFVPPTQIAALAKVVEDAIRTRLEHTAAMDAQARMADAFWFASAGVVEFLGSSKTAANGNGVSNGNGATTPLGFGDLPAALAAWRAAGAAKAFELLRAARDGYQHGAAAQHLGRGTRLLYEFVRVELGIKLRKGDVFSGGHQSPSIGSAVGVVYDALRQGRAEPVIAQVLAQL
ncbi:phenylalanine ammonia-lyase [Auricularia subglabra TFB-10046 SS5]|nr:phenylalanine ammonia-lyase [Auricularia subglabra TFB-10046 SS5]